MNKLLLAVTLLLFSFRSYAQDTSIVYFDFDRWELTDAAKQQLDAVIAKPNLYSASLHGHCDQLGSRAYNEKLSLKRAEAVRDYLVSKGADPRKITLIKGYGEDVPVIDKLDADSRRANRRVVVIADYEVFAKDSSVMEAPKQVDTPVVKSPVQPVKPKPAKEKLIDEIRDSATKEGDRIVLRNINFYGGRHVFLPQSYPALMELLSVMQSVPSLEIEIQGHICCMDGDGDGVDLDTGEPFLSYNRARAVYEFLLKRGIDKRRMTYRGFGHRYPIIPYETTEEERTTNRRVEIRIVKK